LKKTLLLLFLFLFVEIIPAQQLSNTAEISVLTVGPGTSLNDAFGHSAFRINDPNLGLDIVYGYGEYDFDAPNFYFKFAQGKLNYLISKTTFTKFYQFYNYFNRSIKEQVLNLSGSDNSVRFNPPKDFKDATFRTLIQNNLNKNTWGSLGIDLALGSVIDQKAAVEDHMFLPENIYRFFENATVGDYKKPLVKKSITLLSKKDIPQSDSFFTSPLFILSLISLVIIWITYMDHKNNKRTRWLDVALFTITGLIGVLILFLWFATDHTGTHQNYNLLWGFGLNLFFIGQVIKRKASAWFVKYIKFLIILLCLLTLHWSIGVQVFAIGLIPLLVALFIRYLFLVKHYNTI